MWPCPRARRPGRLDDLRDDVGRSGARWASAVALEVRVIVDPVGASSGTFWQAHGNEARHTEQSGQGSCAAKA